MPINLQNFAQKDLTELKIFQNVLEGYFLNILYSHKIAFEPTCVYVIVLKFASVTILKARTSALDKWQITTIQDEVWLFIF